ncbi:MAG: DNA-3-methyladenine glycosylase 2 family protein [Pseudomonadota bacterium]
MPKQTKLARIETEADISRGVRALKRRCQIVQRMHAVTGNPPVRVQEPGFKGLARIIVGQQLSVASAAAIWGRCEQKIQPFTSEKLARCRDTTLKAAGVSAPKIRTLKAAAAADRAGQLLLKAPDASDEDVRESLVAVSGIGPWTADIYLMFALGRPDAFAPGDLALQIGAQFAFDLDDRPKPDALEALADHWRPWRSVAARILWAYYAAVKSQKTSAVPV